MKKTEKEYWTAVLCVWSITIGLVVSVILFDWAALVFWFGALIGVVVGIEVFLGHLRRFRFKPLGGWVYSAEPLHRNREEKAQ